MRVPKPTKFFAHKKLKKPPSKVAQNYSNPLFFPYCPDCPNGPNRRIPVPKCGLLTNYYIYYIELQGLSFPAMYCQNDLVTIF